MTEEQKQRARRIIAEQLGMADSQITDSTLIGPAGGFDSLDDVELLMALEDEFAIEIADDDAEQCDTVGDLIALVERVDQS